MADKTTSEMYHPPITRPANLKVYPGVPYPLGATFDGTGTNFSIFSEVAHAVELCLYDEQGNERQILLPEMTGYIWHGYLPTVGVGQRYGYRVYGPWHPEQGQRCNAAKLLIDPYAKALAGLVKWDEAVFGHRWLDPDGKPNEANSAAFMPKCVVINPYFDWKHDRSPNVSLHETIIYEVHVKGFTQLHPDIPEELRGTYAGLAHPAAIDYFKNLGVTAVELMPIHQFIQDKNLLDKGLRNYWGYNSICYFAPHDEYAATGQLGQQVQEFKQMVQAFHQAGIEIILDVVYNHTAEGNRLGPTLSFKGIDNQAYYRLVPDDLRYYMDYTGTGNTLNMRHPHVLQMVMDSLRYWVTEMHVDGFRFDLAATLARGLHEVDRLSAFFDLIQQDPIISQVKLIAEPWDVGGGGYQVGNFPPQWSEWNGKYRDCVRDFWRGQDATLGELANRLAGSSDLYENTGRRPHASVNFVTAHDGFTLEDLVSYNEKHNEANQDDNTDGESHNRSWNCGAEGPSDDPNIRTLRDRQKRNLLTTLMLSQGIPMLRGGDEIGITQHGNNNTYCQNNDMSWYQWDKADKNLLEFVQKLVHFRTEHVAFRRWKWFQGRPIWGTGVSDIGWFKPDGTGMPEEEWSGGVMHTLLVFLNGKEIAGLDTRGERVIDDDFCILINAHHEKITFVLPEAVLHIGAEWARILDTFSGDFNTGAEMMPLPENKIEVEARSIVVLRHEG